MRAFAVCLLFFASKALLLAANPPEQKANPADLLSEAADALDISSTGQSFAVQGEFTISNWTTGKVRGLFAMVIAPDNRAHIQIQLPGINDHIWIHDQLEWRWNQSGGPPRQTELEIALQPRDLLRANYADAKFKSSEKKINGVKQPCIQMEQRGVMRPLLCVDASNHAPSQLEWAGYDFLFSDYRQEGAGVLPFSFRITGNGSEILSGSVTNVPPITNLQAMATPPPGSSPLAGLACIAGSDDIKHHTDPVYPATAKMARIQGVVTLSVEVDQAGKVRSVHVISGHPMLTPSAAEAVAHWEFKPHVCDGQSVGSHRIITVDFELD